MSDAVVVLTTLPADADAAAFARVLQHVVARHMAAVKTAAMYTRGWHGSAV